MFFLWFLVFFVFELERYGGGYDIKAVVLHKNAVELQMTVEVGWPFEVLLFLLLLLSASLFFASCLQYIYIYTYTYV